MNEQHPKGGPPCGPYGFAGCYCKGFNSPEEAENPYPAERQLPHKYWQMGHEARASIFPWRYIPTEAATREVLTGDSPFSRIADADENARLRGLLWEAREALRQIAEYDGEPIWQDDRGDAAYEMLRIAVEAHQKTIP